jgi:hypothetical protein
MENLIAAMRELQASQQMVINDIKDTRADHEKMEHNQEKMKVQMDVILMPLNRKWKP